MHDGEEKQAVQLRLNSHQVLLFLYSDKELYCSYGVITSKAARIRTPFIHYRFRWVKLCPLNSKNRQHSLTSTALICYMTVCFAAIRTMVTPVTLSTAISPISHTCFSQYLNPGFTHALCHAVGCLVPDCITHSTGGSLLSVLLPVCVIPSFFPWNSLSSN